MLTDEVDLQHGWLPVCTLDTHWKTAEKSIIGFTCCVPITSLVKSGDQDRLEMTSLSCRVCVSNTFSSGDIAKQ